jgi:hypothetical protein
MLGIGSAGRITVSAAAVFCLGLIAACGTSGARSDASADGSAARSGAATSGGSAGHGSGAAAAAAATAGPAGTPGTSKPGAGGPAGGPVKRADFVSGISCTSSSDCLAAGWYYYGTAGPSHTLVEALTGTRWSVVQLPADARAGTLTAISCAGASCTAVGSPLVGRHGHGWKVELRSSPFDAVSCPTPSSCVAVGVTSSGTAEAGTWNGSGWAIRRMPALPRPAQTVTLSGISCASPDACMAVGDYSYGATAQPGPGYHDGTLAEWWNGSAWTLLPSVSVPHSSRLMLRSVSCTGPKACVAVGQANAQETLAEQWNGASWHAERTPNYNPVGYSELTGISCVSATSCVAVGNYNLGIPFAEIHDGSGWKLSHLALPAVQKATQGLTVSCAGDACMAAGAEGGQTLAEYWNGSSWQLQATLNPR